VEIKFDKNCLTFRSVYCKHGECKLKYDIHKGSNIFAYTNNIDSTIIGVFNIENLSGLNKLSSTLSAKSYSRTSTQYMHLHLKHNKSLGIVCDMPLLGTLTYIYNQI
jgi:hypothetical protein